MSLRRRDVEQRPAHVVRSIHRDARPQVGSHPLGVALPRSLEYIAAAAHRRERRQHNTPRQFHHLFPSAIQ